MATRAKAAQSKTESVSRAKKPFPALSFEDAILLANAIQEFGGGTKMRRLTLFDKLGKAPDSGPSRQLIIDSGRYGLTKGGYHADYIELTAPGAAATDPDATAAAKLHARFELAITGVPAFKALYEQYSNARLPAHDVMQDFVRENGVPEKNAKECVDTFVVNAKFLGLIRTVSGVERLLPVEHILEELPATEPDSRGGVATEPAGDARVVKVKARTSDWGKTCFYISPIGDPESVERKHSDFFLTQLVEPAVKEFGLDLVRADQIGKPGMITGQVIEYITRSRLAIADLSFHNPNVFYELCLRHACRLPTVHLIRKTDRIPFDLEQFRTIPIDTNSVYDLVPKIETHRSEIANQIRRALNNPEDVENPITVFCPGLKVTIPKP